ncbi:hypothetical protein [Chryseobacterium polytrichastri]|uniref:Uncharacterized protein n=1 Tax=Chryseobacterium polytrichastri TaxID=1302687 RepID=A0A1M6YMK8_9FLAO|nr:hypothetical protein [Chryseobacterium polytrichastri]SHL19457.1 hypothetical protein SAMN05444267_1013102 [Chryseobacterium polytrichastri]
MNNNIKGEIFEFINQYFSNDRKILREKANEFLKESYLTDLFLKEFESINIVTHFQSLSSETDKFLKEEMGDISDVWTFYLNEDIDEVDTSEGYEDWDFRKYLETGKSLHCCRVWINWFLKIYYIQNFGIVRKEKIETDYILKTFEAYENEKYNSILNIMNKKGYEKITDELALLKVESISTDCNDNPNIFDCLFSDIIYPIHFRIN